MSRLLQRLLATLRLVAIACWLLPSISCHSAPPRPPNILWIVAEDMNLELGAYGDPVARTPNLDRLAAEGVRFTNVFAASPVCAPSRASLVTGVHATSIGAQHMRSSDGGYRPVPPPEVKTFTELLRAAGYWAGNVVKLDYQFSGVLNDAPITNWDDEAGADWADRREGQPFFFYATSMSTHEGQLHGGPHALETDPASVTIPPYYPDTPAVRADFARFYDNVARMDAELGAVLDRLEEEGLADDTVVFFFADNGRGFPRDKRWVYDGGIHEPLIVRWPGHLAPGTTNDALVSFVDLAPTVLSIAGVPVPSWMQGRVFLGDDAEPPPEFVFASSDRNDEATDRIRAVRDRAFKYIRNYMPEVPYGQTIAYRDQLATMQEIHRLESEGQLVSPADWYFVATKPEEELYDVVADPYELVNLAGDPAYLDVLERMRAAHARWVIDTGDTGATPEPELAETFWPGGVQPVTPAPAIDAAPLDGGQVEATIYSDVEGASIAYRVEGAEPPTWQLYVDPVVLAPGETLEAVAVRYGWAESEPVAYVAGE